MNVFTLFKIKNKAAKPVQAEEKHPLPQVEDPGNEISTFNRKMNDFGYCSNEEYCSRFLSLIARRKEIVQAAVYLWDQENNPPVLRFFAGYACNPDYNRELVFAEGEGLPGQVIRDRKILNLKNIPQGYLSVSTGLGEAAPCSLLLIPVVKDERVLGLIELASFHVFTDKDENFLSSVSTRMFEKLEGVGIQL